MKIILLITLLIVTSCSPKIKSDKTIKTIKRVDRDTVVFIPESFVRQITPLAEIRERTTIKTDKKTGVKVSYEINEKEELIAEITVPEKEEAITVTDTYVNTEREVVKEKSKGVWATIKEKVNTILIFVFLFVIGYFLSKLN